MSKYYKIEKKWYYKNLPCAVIGVNVGHRCGYVGVPITHFLAGVEYHQHCEELKKAHTKALNGVIGKRGVLSLIPTTDNTYRPDFVFDVHGSLTFSQWGFGGYPYPSTNTWWFGFDCAHAGDAKDVELMDETHKDLERQFPVSTPGDVVRTLEYCTNECESLATQIDKLTR